MTETADTPLRRARNARGLTLEQLSSGVNLDPATISRIERGETCSADAAERLAAFFGENTITELEILYPERYEPKKVAAGK